MVTLSNSEDTLEASEWTLKSAGMVNLYILARQNPFNAENKKFHVTALDVATDSLSASSVLWELGCGSTAESSSRFEALGSGL